MEAECRHGRDEVTVAEQETIPTSKAVKTPLVKGKGPAQEEENRHHAYGVVCGCIVFRNRILHARRVQIVGCRRIIEELADTNILVLL